MRRRAFITLLGGVLSTRRVGKGALRAVPTWGWAPPLGWIWICGGGHASLCPPYGSCADEVIE
jgi:hypothetical protein